jgi:Na+/H+ antiporter NhaD/arsenite permease-like protein
MGVNNITVMLFMTRLTLRICEDVPLAPVPLIVGEVCAANMLGASTLIGAPPNLVMAGTLGYGFMRVMAHMAPGMFLCTAVFMAAYFHQNRDRWRLARRPPASSDPRPRMTGWRFFLRIDYETLLFFMGLFILIGALDQVGIFRILARRLSTIENPVLLMLATLWLSAFASALVDNIPMALAMAYLIRNLAMMSPGFPAGILVWATLIGLTLGGNMTPIGASPNVVAYGILEKRKMRTGWKNWAQLAVPSTLLALLTASGWMWISFRLGWY